MWSELPKHIHVRVNMNDKKGMIANIPGEPVGMQDVNARKLTHGFHLKVTGVRNVQPDPSKVSYKEASVLVVKSTRDYSREQCTIKVPLKRLCYELPSVLREDIGATPVCNLDAALKANRESVGISFEEDDKYGGLLNLIFAASVGDADKCAPTYTTESWVEGDSWYTRGKRVGPAVEINREMKDPKTGEVLYRLRAPRLTGDGWEYCTATWNELLSGTYRFNDGRNMSVTDPTQAFLAITDRWNSLNDGQRNAQMLEEKHQPEKDLQAERNATFGFRRP